MRRGSVIGVRSGVGAMGCAGADGLFGAPGLDTCWVPHNAGVSGLVKSSQA